MTRRQLLLVFVLSLLSLVPIWEVAVRFAPLPTEKHLFAKPYLQLGNNPKRSGKESITIIWQTLDTDEDNWSLEIQNEGNESFSACPATFTKADLGYARPFRIFRSTLIDRPSNKPFNYRLLQNGNVVFSGTGTTPSENKEYRFAVFGDCGANSPGQKKVAFQTYQQKPDFVVITGDIVYEHGRASEYWEKFYPVYNADTASAEEGAPLLRSVFFMPAPGNHDLDIAYGNLSRNLETFPDGLAYYFNWDLPLNGPINALDAPNSTKLIGSRKKKLAFLEIAGDHYPRMSSYSFDWGNSHWLMLDGNNYVDWTNPIMRAWVENDLKSASNATWRFVAVHQPGFNSDPKHPNDQRLRVLSDLFEKYNVDICFAGHDHSYQRSYPLHFSIEKTALGNFVEPNGVVHGTITKVDHGVIYIVDGAGGAPLSGQAFAANKSLWQPFTEVFISNVHSFSSCEIKGNSFLLRQISEDGKEIDRLSIVKTKVAPKAAR